MHQLASSLASRQDPWLVLLAAATAAAGAFAMFVLGGFAARRRAGHRLFWTGLSAMASCVFIWASAVLNMLGFDPGVPFTLLPGPMVASLAAGFLLAAAGVSLAVNRRTVAAQFLAGLIGGATITVITYGQMMGLRFAGAVSWDVATLLVSVLVGLFGMGLGAIAGYLTRGLHRKTWPVLVTMSAVVAEQLLALHAMTIVPDPAVKLPPGGLNTVLLATGAFNCALILLGLAVAPYYVRRRMQAIRLVEQRRLRELADVALEGLVICDGELVVEINDSLSKRLPGDRKMWQGRKLEALLPGWSLAAVPHEREVDAELLSLEGLSPVRIIARPIQLEDRPHTVVAVRDQRERLTAEAEMRRLADTDPLTGLANRARFNAALTERCAARREMGRAFAVLAVDLDRFKAVNDRSGHEAGDRLLARVAARLQALVREPDLVARLGGDEFAVLAEGVDGTHRAQALADQLVDVLSRPYVIEGRAYEVGASVGVAVSPSDGMAAEVLARNADLALQRAKEDGKGVYRMFEREMDARMQARRNLEFRLRRAVTRHEFRLFYQPQVDAQTGAFEGAEALIRWCDAERGMVSPAEFIPLAEETGLISAIGEWVLRTACAEAQTWPAHLSVAVNLSPAQFRGDGLAATIRSVLAETGLTPSRLELEITEGVLLQDEATTLQTLTELRAMGIRISLDDFGTGYSSLSYLRRFPFDKIKIDQSFIRRTPEDRDSTAIVRAVVSLGTSLGMATTAEGVETEAQQAFVAAEGCSQIQGYLTGRPVPREELWRPVVQPVVQPAVQSVANAA